MRESNCKKAFRRASGLQILKPHFETRCKPSESKEGIHITTFVCIHITTFVSYLKLAVCEARLTMGRPKDFPVVFQDLVGKHKSKVKAEKEYKMYMVQARVSLLVQRSQQKQQ